MISDSFWKDKRVFITGHTGFKGSWLSLWLLKLGAIVKGYSLLPPTKPSLYEEVGLENRIVSQIGDIRNLESLKKSIEEFQPEVVFHLAAQAIVRDSYDDPIETYTSNIIGTVNVLESIRAIKTIKSVIIITSDKCYQNNDNGKSFSEDDPMGGFAPYSSSKGCAELVTNAYRNSFFTNSEKGLASVRAGNVIGGGDWSKDRLIPDILNALSNNTKVIIRNPDSIRPWQHVLEPLSGYLVLAEKLFEDHEKYSCGWNFGPEPEEIRSVKWILEKISMGYSKVDWSLDGNNNPHESKILRLNIEKVKKELCWKPIWTTEIAIEKIVNWHQCWFSNQGDTNYIFELCMSDISSYEHALTN